MTSLLDRSLTFEGILAERGDPMAACDAPWLAHLREIPEDASPPLAMSAPHPQAVGSYGAECVEWMRSELKVNPRWWQELAITRQLEHDDGGQLVYPDVIESGTRRIGKSTRLRGVALWRTDNAERIGEKQLSMLVSKDLAVGKEIHRGGWRWAEEKGWKVTRLGGAQEIEKTEDESRWLLRAENAVYGYDVGYGQVDESWGVDPQAITDGLEPALLERLWAQLHLTSTAHVKATSLMRRRLVSALRNADPNVLLLFWGARPDADYSKVETWKAASAYWSDARRQLIERKYLAALAGDDDPEFDDPDPVRGWAAQYLNAWPLLLGGGADTIFPNWSDLASTDDAPAPAALGVASDLEQTWLSLGASSGGDRPHVGSVLRARASGASAFVAEAKRIQAERKCAVAIDRKGPASFLIPDLEAAGVRLTFLSLDDFVQACSDFEKAVARAAVSHGDYAELNAAVDAAGWRKVGDRRAFARKSGDISSLESVAVAFWAATHKTTSTDAWRFWT